MSKILVVIVKELLMLRLRMLLCLIFLLIQSICLADHNSPVEVMIIGIILIMKIGFTIKGTIILPEELVSYVLEIQIIDTKAWTPG